MRAAGGQAIRGGTLRRYRWGSNSSDVAADDPESLTIPTSHLVGFVLASLAIIIVPGPSVLFTLARGIAWGRAVAVLTVVGNGLGMLLLSLLVAVGLGPLLSRSKLFTTVIEVAGGLYLLWLGADALRHRHAHAASMTDREATKPSASRVIRQGFFVGGFNPKALIFFVAVFPHFVDRSAGSVTMQLALLGVIFTVLAVLSDGTWGVVAGTAREWLARSPGRLVALRTIGGVVMLGLGVLILASAILS